MFKEGSKYSYLVTFIKRDAYRTKISDMEYVIENTNNPGPYDKYIIAASNNISVWK